MHGGQQTSTVKVTLQPRIQKDRWSMYWKESMATKTDSFEAITVEADVNTTVGKLQQELAEKLKWQPVDSLVRLEGFKGPWEFAVFKGRSVNPAVSLKANGIITDATITVVRQVLMPEAWKSITDVQSTAEDSSSEDEEDTF
ncbi:TPA: hypothetical protein ACH3X3_002175 [Trebouxia sp. C0006]